MAELIAYGIFGFLCSVFFAASAVNAFVGYRVLKVLDRVDLNISSVKGQIEAMAVNKAAAEAHPDNFSAAGIAEDDDEMHQYRRVVADYCRQGYPAEDAASLASEIIYGQMAKKIGFDGPMGE